MKVTQLILMALIAMFSQSLASASSEKFGPQSPVVSPLRPAHDPGRQSLSVSLYKLELCELRHFIVAPGANSQGCPDLASIELIIAVEEKFEHKTAFAFRADTGHSAAVSHRQQVTSNINLIATPGNSPLADAAATAVT